MTRPRSMLQRLILLLTTFKFIECQERAVISIDPPRDARVYAHMVNAKNYVVNWMDNGTLFPMSCDGRIRIQPGFPKFLCHLLDLLDTEKEQKYFVDPIKKVHLGEFNGLVKELVKPANHPCADSCVVIAIPNRIMLGCLNETGHLDHVNHPNVDRRLPPGMLNFDMKHNLIKTRSCDVSCEHSIFTFDGIVLIEDHICCCEGPTCATVIFDQGLQKPLPFIRANFMFSEPSPKPTLHPPHYTGKATVPPATTVVIYGPPSWESAWLYLLGASVFATMFYLCILNKDTDPPGTTDALDRVYV